MKATLALVVVLLLCRTAPSLAQAPTSTRETWEICLDDGDFSFTVNDFLRSLKAVKDGCQLRFSEGGGQGMRFEINVCDPANRLDQYDSLESTTATRLYAGSAGCDLPLFGADIGPTAGSGPAYLAAREKVFAILAKLEKAYGVKKEKADFAQLKSRTEAGSAAKIACADLLLTDYLRKCAVFPAPATGSSPKPKR